MSRTHSPSFPSLHLRHSSFSNPSLPFPTSQLILQPFHCFTYITVHSPTLISLLLCHRIFTCVSWRAARGEREREKREREREREHTPVRKVYSKYTIPYELSELGNFCTVYQNLESINQSIVDTEFQTN